MLDLIYTFIKPEIQRRLTKHLQKSVIRKMQLFIEVDEDTDVENGNNYLPNHGDKGKVCTAYVAKNALDQVTLPNVQSYLEVNFNVRSVMYLHVRII